jgi:DNA-directed RNA polymerase specialized sigma24 family protein
VGGLGGSAPQHDRGDPVRAFREHRSPKPRVELCRRYSNREELLKPLVSVLHSIEQDDKSDVPGVRLNRSSQQIVTLLDHLSPDSFEVMSELYLAGMPAQEIADRAGVSLSKVTKMLHQHGVKRDQ